MPRKAIDLTGQRINNLHIVKRAPNQGTSIAWHCLCDCGRYVFAITSNILAGRIKSCGCKSVPHNQRHSSHGMSFSRTYKSWSHMIDRCRNPNNHKFKDYGKRGISVCEQWHTFEKFLSDMGEVPKNHTIDRIDNNGNYEPGNCKWSTPAEQNNNKRSNIILTHNGKTLNISQWSVELGIGDSTLRKRIAMGWSIEKTLATPVH